MSSPAGAQNGQHGAMKSTKAGVYTREQAARGQDIYAGNCRSCHTPESHAGEQFTTRWRDKPLSELFVYIRDQMPKNDPGSMPPEEYADVTAYLLMLNRMPQGDTELRAHPDSLKSIRIDLPPMPVRKDP
ncbi:MAG TPA: c-type cytochrome [Gemmatimonadaceae bacterium]|nr:c-type cytochrome [Gemmatimonadaceae bacterium]